MNSAFYILSTWGAEKLLYAIQDVPTNPQEAAEPTLISTIQGNKSSSCWQVNPLTRTPIKRHTQYLAKLENCSVHHTTKNDMSTFQLLDSVLEEVPLPLAGCRLRSNFLYTCVG
jgi:hypothetical protein